MFTHLLVVLTQVVEDVLFYSPYFFNYLITFFALNLVAFIPFLFKYLRR